MPSLLFLSPRQSYPITSGAKLRDFHFARALARHFELTYLHFSDGPSPDVGTGLPFAHRIVSVPRPKGYAPANLLRGAVGSTALPVLNYASEAMHMAVRDVMRSTRFSLIHADSLHMEQFVRTAQQVAAVPCVYNWHNIESEAMRRFADAVSSVSKRWYARRTAGLLASLEDEMLRDALGHVVCSPRESREIAQLAPRARVHVAENGVDTDFFTRAAAATHGTVRLVFVGSMDYFPNIEAARHFVATTWPAVRAAYPTAVLQIVGANPTAEVRALNAVDGVEVTGTVADVRPYYEQALAAIVPLLSGAGTRLKILEAMAMETPVISTAIGAEGLDLQPDHEFLLARQGDVAQWLSHIGRLADDAAYRAALAARGRRVVTTRFDWHIIGERLAEVYADWLDATAAHVSNTPAAFAQHR